MTPFKNYLIGKGFAKNTIQGHTSSMNLYLEWCALEDVQSKKSTYDDLMNYVAYCQSQGNVAHTINSKISGLNYYFKYLEKEHGVQFKNGNPAKLLKIKGRTNKIPHQLLTSEELIEIYNLQTTYGLAQKRNKVLLSLAIFQGVRSSDLGRIEVKDIDLMEGKIYIPAGRGTNSRTLDLKPQQLLLFQDYLMNVRPTILKEASKQSDYFLVHAKPKNQPIMSNVISLLLYRLRPYYPKLKSLRQIRQSTITEWLKIYGLRQTQYMAGHRYVSSTERYNVDKMEGLKKELKNHYVLDK